MEKRKEFVKCCPRKVFSFNELKQTVDIEDADKCNLCNECYFFACQANDLEKAVKITEDDHKFIFTVESTGALQPDDIVKKALAILKQKIANFRKELLDNVTGNMGAGQFNN